jgi:signal transduction histidine kinase
VADTRTDPPTPVSSAVTRIAGTARVSAARLFAGGCGLAAIVVLAGFGLELYRFGVDDSAAAARLAAGVQASVADMTADVTRAAQAISGDPIVRDAMAASPDSDAHARALFDAAQRVRQASSSDESVVALTIYDNAGVPRAWAGRASDLPPERTRGAAAVFVSSTPLGLRLVYVEPIAEAGKGQRLGAVAVEDAVAPAPTAAGLGVAVYTLDSTPAPVALRLPQPSSSTPDPQIVSFQVRAADSSPLFDASAGLADLSEARRNLRRTAASAALIAFAVTILLLAGPLLDRRGAARDTAGELRFTAALVLVILGAGAVFWAAVAIAPWARGGVARSAARLCLASGTAAALAATLASALVRMRLSLRTWRRSPSGRVIGFVVAQLAAGVLLAALLVEFERILGRSMDPAGVDLTHFSLHPWAPARIAILAAIVLGHAAVLWLGAIACVAAAVRWRLPRRASSWHAWAAACWVMPTAAVAIAAARRGWGIPPAAVLLGAIVCAFAALVTPRLAGWYRRATVASRLLALFMAFLLPALLVYPTVHFYADRALQQLIAAPERGYAVQAMSHPQVLQAHLEEADAQIDRLPLAALIARAAGQARLPPEGAKTEVAFEIWNQTVLARLRLTSDVELYDTQGALLSRFALNFPESALEQVPSGPVDCRWEVVGEAQSFGGAQERNTLHAQRSVCVDGRPIATLVAHVVFDYRTLPFISSQSAYLDVLVGAGVPPEGLPEGEVEFVAYGWGLTTIYSSGRESWELDPATFARVYRSREPFWTVASKGGRSYHVYFANDRQFIYALGYPLPTVFDHFVRLAELTTLAAVLYVALLMAAALFARLARARPQTGRSLLREIRASFYRKLFLAFVLASIVPVLTLALVVRTYFAGLLMTDIQGEAARTAAVAQRVIEDSEQLARSEGVIAFGDDLMVWISQLINQDVNVFYGAGLAATSERDLFASGLLPTRTPEPIYRAIVLQRLPSIVAEDRIGDVSYMLAAAPIRSGTRNAVLTVPLALRQHEVEREIDDLDRGIHLAALFFILLGAAIGLSMAERIADPIRQLTRATRRIARGDFDARIAVRSSDELRRLVDAFNGMAAELKAQRGQLEKTHRLEAWAEMARQVAHEIKNPLTPIQLSAEHLRRVHADRGEPMGPVLEGCVDSILGQVRLLRQIAAEFSSFASSPTARRQPVDPVVIVRDVVEPYRVPLAGRILLQNEVAAPLPMVLIDRTLAARALANVVENALHAMPGDGRLRLTAHVDGGWVVIDVEDSGVGMDAEALARVFEPYFSTKSTGTGLGLPIAKRNVELSGGTIAVRSLKGAGTTVTIRLPITAGPDAGRA